MSFDLSHSYQTHNSFQTLCLLTQSFQYSPIQQISHSPNSNRSITPRILFSKSLQNNRNLSHSPFKNMDKFHSRLNDIVGDSVCESHQSQEEGELGRHQMDSQMKLRKTIEELQLSRKLFAQDCLDQQTQQKDQIVRVSTEEDYANVKKVSTVDNHPLVKVCTQRPEDIKMPSTICVSKDKPAESFACQKFNELKSDINKMVRIIDSIFPNIKTSKTSIFQTTIPDKILSSLSAKSTRSQYLKKLQRQVSHVVSQFPLESSHTISKFPLESSPAINQQQEIDGFSSIIQQESKLLNIHECSANSLMRRKMNGGHSGRSNYTNSA